ncbi:MMPL family transporter [Nocardia sp. SYP-A9097]|uniref:MMPL family transporter n=1 Tax=Nocardia sp. SYP-A9097 TaxID=2663237 RepID=UPI00129BBF95|nr:MMPL family transporter [Nocardia sp. SYP-A9097]MRH93389.1 MMPL family transporter [Nocardia sp. SYP-A9097]
MFTRLGLFIVRRTRLVLILAAAVTLAAMALAGTAFAKLETGGFTPDNAESTQAQRLIDQHLDGNPNLLLLLEARSGSVDDPAVTAAADRLTTAIGQRAELRNIMSYWTTGAPALKSRDGRYGLISAFVSGDETAAAKTVAALVRDDLGTAGDAVTVRAAGSLAVGNDINTAVMKGLVLAESIALPLTLILLLAIFGSVMAAVLPLLIALLAIAGTFAELSLLAEVTPVSIFATNLITALSLGLAIDYALLTVSRFREELARGTAPSDAVVQTVRTAGRTIVFSAVTVAVALSGVLVFESTFLRSLALAGIGVTIIAAASATILLPALLAVLGPRIDSGRIPFVHSASARPSRTWGRLAATVMRRPVAAAIPVLALLLLAAAPVLRIEFALVDDRSLPAATNSRVALDILRTQFDGDSTATIAAVTTDPVSPTAISDYARRLSTLPGVSRVDSAAGLFIAGTAAGPPRSQLAKPAAQELVIAPYADIHPESATAQTLVRAIRTTPTPEGAHFLVGGTTATLVDTEHAISTRLPWALLILIVTTFVVFFLFTGSAIQPLRALLLNALGLSATFGVMILIFQQGHGSALLGFTPRPLDLSMPVLLLCIAFGLSMDYEVFLISRIKELHDAGASTRDAVIEGLGRTGRIISAAAVLIAVSFFAFALSPVGFAKFFGIAAGLAVVLDATVMRGILVPVTFQLLGERAWYAPRALRRLHQRIGISEHAADTPPLPRVPLHDSPSR